MKSSILFALVVFASMTTGPLPAWSVIPAHPQTRDEVEDFNPDGKLPWLGVSRWMANQREVVLCGVLADGPAGKAGLMANDVIVSINGEPVHDLGTFHTAIDRQTVGSRIPVEFRRGPELKKVTVLLEPLPSDGGVGKILEAIGAGEAWAMMELGVRLAHLRGDRSYVDPDPIAAAQWFWRAVDAGDNCAPVFLAQMYIKGVGVGEDFAVAQQLLIQARKSADEPDRAGVRVGLASAASLRLAQMCLDGQGPDAKQELAVSFLEDAANNGSLQAMFKLGEIFSQGKITPANPDQARRWLSLASQNGHAAASKVLESLEKSTPAVVSKPAGAKSAVGTPDSATSSTTIMPVMDGKSVWAHEGGFFRYCGNSRWIETFRPLSGPTGGFQFTEKTRNDQFVELYDAKRDLTVRLHAGQAQIRSLNYPEFTKMYDGRWLVVATRDSRAP